MITEIRGVLFTLGTPTERDEIGFPRALVKSTEDEIRACKPNLFGKKIAIVAAEELDALRADKARLENLLSAAISCANSLSCWAPECFPKIVNGQKHFARVLMEGVADELRAAMKGQP